MPFFTSHPTKGFHTYFTLPNNNKGIPESPSFPKNTLVTLGILYRTHSKGSPSDLRTAFTYLSAPGSPGTVFSFVLCCFLLFMVGRRHILR